MNKCLYEFLEIMDSEKIVVINHNGLKVKLTVKQIKEGTNFGECVVRDWFTCNGKLHVKL